MTSEEAGASLRTPRAGVSPLDTIARRLAVTALAAYDLGPARLRLLARRWGAVLYQVDAPAGRFVLRLHEPDGVVGDQIRSEVEWLAALRYETDLGVPAPVATRDGSLLATVAAPDGAAPWPAIVLGWVNGRFRDAGLRPVHLAQAGALMAGLHQHAAGFVPPAGFVRPRWDWRPLFGPTSVFAPGRDRGLLTVVDRAIFAAAAARVAAEMAVLEQDPTAAGYGLIHGDLNQTNLLFYQGTARAIDFADCCWGYHLFDMSITLSAVAGRSNEADLRAAFFAGYVQVRPLPPHCAERLPAFSALRLARRVNYLVRSPDPANPALAPGYIRDAVAWLRGFLA
jgi:Ser/Thr protein kinase RdoA (MazF antagonist)